MTVVQVKSFIIDNINATDAEIMAGINVTSTVFSISVIPISGIKSRVIVFFN